MTDGKRAQISSKECVRIRRVMNGTLPCLNNKSESGRKFGDQCLFRHTEAGGQPSKKSKLSVDGAHEAVLDYTDLFSSTSHGDDTQDFDTRWNQVFTINK